MGDTGVIKLTVCFPLWNVNMVIIISVVTIQTTRVQNIVSLKTKRDLATPDIFHLSKKKRKQGKCPQSPPIHKIRDGMGLFFQRISCGTHRYWVT